MSAMKFDLDASSLPGSMECPYDLIFDLYVYKDNERSLAEHISALYCFYSLVKIDGKETPRLLYIGESKDLRTRLLQHAKKPDGFPNDKKTVEVEDLDDYLCDPDDVNRKCFYAYALLDGRSLKKCEAAMIKQFQPPINIKAKKSLGCHEESYFKVGGKWFWYPLEANKVYHVPKD